MSETAPPYETAGVTTMLNQAIDQLIKAHNKQPQTDTRTMNGQPQPELVADGRAAKATGADLASQTANWICPV